MKELEETQQQVRTLLQEKADLTRDNTLELARTTKDRDDAFEEVFTLKSEIVLVR